MSLNCLFSIYMWTEVCVLLHTIIDICTWVQLYFNTYLANSHRVDISKPEAITIYLWSSLCRYTSGSTYHFTVWITKKNLYRLIHSYTTYKLNDIIRFWMLYTFWNFCRNEIATCNLIAVISLLVWQDILF